MKESRYNMYMKNVETLDTNMGHHCAAASITKKGTSRPHSDICLRPPIQEIRPGNVYKVIVSQMKASTLNH